MQLFVRKGSSVVPVFSSATQVFVDTEDFILAMLKYAKPCGNVDNMYVEFENTKVPVSHVSEIRVLAHMAAAYHNACLAQNLAAEKDLYGMPYTAEAWPDISRRDDRCDETTSLQSSVTETAENFQFSDSGTKSKDTAKDHWDEELEGERIVFDSTFEVNEHLVPWLMDPDSWEEKYGMY